MGGDTQVEMQCFAMLNIVTTAGAQYFTLLVGIATSSCWKQAGGWKVTI